MELGFKALVIFTIFQRLAELVISKRNEKHIISLGGKVLPEKNYIFMVLLHTSWLVVLLYCAFKTPLHLHPASFAGFTFLFLLGQFFRISAITTLGKRWSTRVMILPEAPVIKSGLFKLVRHPNYVGVILEIAALPLIAGFWKIALLFSISNGIILFFRIRFEEKMLSTHNDYQQQFFEGSPS
ncbi:MAG: hypothetical protein NXH75_13355 [Halobacteriovoraceae bacterium]|nr:hypothetical protein [Halobacteriovoraceae bacterium]